MYLYTSFLIFNIVMIVFSKNIDVKTGLEEPIPFSVGLKFLAEINNLKDEDCFVEVYPDECCLYNNDNKCDIIEVMGIASDVISGGATKTFTMVAPLLDAYQRRGYCTLYIDSRPVSKPKAMTRETVKIKFDTKLINKTLSRNIQLCKLVDEDPLNDCKPVECDSYYNGKRPHFNVKKQRCIEAPTCVPKNRISRTVYNPISNKCIDESALGKNDLNYIKHLSKNSRPVKEVLLLNVAPTTDKTISYSTIANDRMETEIMTSTTVEIPSALKKEHLKTMAKEKYDAVVQAKDKLKNTIKAKVKAKTKTKAPTMAERAMAKVKDKALSLSKERKKALRKQKVKNFIKYLKCNKYTVIVLSCISMMQCCLICTMVYCMTKNCMCKKKLEKKFFNDRHDASITTPLIGTSNMDTETTECQYMSESSNFIEKKIKSYKACQRDKENSMKLSMSDDIISKCITRRNWLSLPRSETIPEVKIDEDLKTTKRAQSDHKKIPGTKVNFQDDYQNKKSNIRKIIVKNDMNNPKSNDKQFNNSSERQIRCHNYNTDNNAKVNTTTLQSNCLHYTSGIYTKEKNKSDSIAKSAQACFSNDSIEDFLSEKGIVFIDDIASKCTNSYTSLTSAAKSTSSSHSSKTSKNNIVRNIMTLLPKKIKGPSSDPGIQKSSNDLDLELLYVSRVSLASSFENDGYKDKKSIKGATKTFTMIAPLLDPYERKGYCTFYIDTRPASRPRTITRDTVKIKFNTRLKKNTLPDKAILCKYVDEDPLNECKPVNCEIYYNGKRSHFCEKKQRCIGIPTCLSNKSRIPKAIYNPVSNKCVRPIIDNNDLYYIKELTKDNSNTITENDLNLKHSNLFKNVLLSNAIMEGDTKVKNQTEPKAINKTKLKEQQINKKNDKTKMLHAKPSVIDAKAVAKDSPKMFDQTMNFPGVVPKEIPENKEIPNEMFSPKIPPKYKVKPKQEIGIEKFEIETVTTTTMEPIVIVNKDLEPTRKASIRAKIKAIFFAATKFLKSKIQKVINFIESNKCTAMILPAILVLQCCLICTMLYCLKQKRAKKKPLLKKYFNYRQDASVTTPLIGTNNIDTETTEFQYMSESSNYIDKKIKCYKAFQRDRKNSINLSMSDDILSKCITRRDWLRLPKSETIPEMKTDEEIKIKKETRSDQKKSTEMKVNFKEDHPSKKNRAVKSISKRDNNNKSNENHLSSSSEKEIRCHNYNFESNSNVNSLCKTFGIYSQDKNRADSIEKGAQAYFSNDSLDEFLSERGVLFIGDNISKYSYTSLSSEARSSVSSQSSKTSKNNIVKNYMTLMTKKSKGPSSDPGIKKTTDELDLNIIQLSRNSVASIDGSTDIKRLKDSTSSL